MHPANLIYQGGRWKKKVYKKGVLRTNQKKSQSNKRNNNQNDSSDEREGSDNSPRKSLPESDLEDDEKEGNFEI